MRRLLFTLAIAFLAAGLGGCTGRGGSQGFDITENAAIDQALEDNECVDFEDLTICPAGQSSPDTPTPGGEPSIDTGVAGATAIDCYQAVPGSTCTAVLRFTPHAFPSQTAFAVFWRADAARNPWILCNEPVPVSGTSSFDATLVLTTAQGPPNEVQLSILAFTDASSSSGSVQDLSQTAASFAFVTQVLTVNLVSPTPTTTPTRRVTGTPTPTQTPGANDCCQCSSSCAAPIAGVCAEGCDVMYGTVCFGEELCVLHTPTPTPSPSPTPTGCLIDNADGTISDRCTGLMWEKKDQAGGSHDYAESYQWSGVCDDSSRMLCQPSAEAAAACAAQTNGAYGCAECAPGVACKFALLGSYDPFEPPTDTIWGWLAQLNQGSGFAGYTDWRIPTTDDQGDVAELDSLILPSCTQGPLCVSPLFNSNCELGPPCSSNNPCRTGEKCVQRPISANPTCEPLAGCSVAECSCTFGLSYWSASTDVTPARTPGTKVWTIGFAGSGGSHAGTKEGEGSVRAVRGIASITPTSTPGTPTATPTPCQTDNGDGTITDACTNLMWEKKDRAGGVHDRDNRYTWAGLCSDNTTLCQPNAAAAATCATQTGGALGCDECPSGTCFVDPDQNGAVTTIWDWLSQIHAGGIAGYADWRIPEVGFDGGAPEYESIRSTPLPNCPGFPLPCVPDAFDSDCTAGCTTATCSCTQSDSHWTAVSNLGSPNGAWALSFGLGGFGPNVPKTYVLAVKAVRTVQ